MAVQINPMEPVTTEQTQPKSDIKILVVDDREDNLLSIETILAKEKYTIIKATSGRAALKILLTQHDFSLILMDVQMPDLDGFETATIIYERDKLRAIPIIFITAHDYGEDYIFQGYRMGGVDYIYKPIKPELLRAKVGVFVELYRKNQQLQQQEKTLLEVNKTLQKEIEDRKLTEDKIRQLNEQLLENVTHLKAVNEELDQFAYVASHDLQEPLRKIMVFSDKILTKSEQDPETSKYFKKIISSSQRMQSLINDLLSFSRHSMSTSDFKKTNLNQSVQEAMTELEIEIEKSQAVINVAPLPEIWAVPSLIQQLFYNLIGNAIKFRKKEIVPVIDIQSRKLNHSESKSFFENTNGTSYFQISVSDNGIGFDNKYAAEIFMVFKRLHSYHEFEGSGVGLSICKKIVDKHRGYIKAESMIDRGATFMIALPEKQVDIEEKPFHKK
jgi:signal transduction histidine kinase